MLLSCIVQSMVSPKKYLEIFVAGLLRVDQALAASLQAQKWNLEKHSLTELISKDIYHCSSGDLETVFNVTLNLMCGYGVNVTD